LMEKISVILEIKTKKKEIWNLKLFETLK
jgi:hypothetical protein